MTVPANECILYLPNRAERPNVVTSRSRRPKRVAHCVLVSATAAPPRLSCPTLLRHISDERRPVALTVVSTRNVCRRKWKEETSNECGLTCHKNPARTRRVPGTDRAHRHPVSRNPRPVVAQPDGLRSVAHRPPRAPGGSASDRGCPHTTLGSALFQARRERMGAWWPAATPRATRVAPTVDKYRRSSRVRSAEEHPWWPCGVAKSPGTRHGPGHGDPRGPVSALRSTQIRTSSFQIRLARHLCRSPTCNDISDDFSDDSRCASLARRPSERTLPLVGRRWSSAARRHWPLGSSATVPRASLAWLMSATSATYTCRPAAPEPPTYAARSGGRQHGLWVPSRRGQQPFSLSNERVGRGAFELAACAAHEHR